MARKAVTLLGFQCLFLAIHLDLSEMHICSDCCLGLSEAHTEPCTQDPALLSLVLSHLSRLVFFPCPFQSSLSVSLHTPV